MKFPTKRLRAFSLLELLVVLALIAVIATLGLPNLQQLLERNQSRALSDQISASFRFARNQAVQQSKSVGICGSLDGASCSNNWQQGWRIFDPASNQTLQNATLNSSNHRLFWRGFRQQVQYLADGSAPVSNGRLLICRQQSLDYLLILNRQGRLRIASPKEHAESQSLCS